MAIDLTYERFVRSDLKDFLKELCCEPLSFMWNNHLLSPRDQWLIMENDDQYAKMRFNIGFRVRRQFMFLKRDQTLYRCPFCNNELVFPLGYIGWDEKYMAALPLSLAMGIPVFEISKPKLKKYLDETKRQCHGVWPPKD